MKFIVIVVVLLGGCAPYAQVQSDLLRQVHRGIGLTQQSLAQKSQIIAGYHELRRKQLDEAFDADVRDRREFSSDWIIEHRKAYAAALDLLNSARAQSDQAADVDRRNLAAMDQVIQRLSALQSFQSQWLNFLPANQEISNEHN